MTNKLLYAAESWDKVYQAFEKVNFTSYDYDSVKQSLIDYLKLNYPENFNDYIESSELIALIETFAYVAEQHSYRMDMLSHENMLPTARRKQSILRLANLISYTASRNVPLRGFVKIKSVSCSEDISDSQGNSLSNRIINWSDPNNPLWKEQFFLVMNHILVSKYGSPYKSVQVDNVILQQYEVNNLLESQIEGTSFTNGTLNYSSNINGQDVRFELVPADLDDAGVFERIPNPSQHFSLVYADDGFGDSSEMTGFLIYIKQGFLQKLTYVFDSSIPNRSIDIDVSNINDVDVWLTSVDDSGNILNVWEQVNTINGSNLAFNTNTNSKKYEVITRENDQIRLNFGSGDYADIPIGTFNIWIRSSNSGNISVNKNDIQNVSTTFAYTSRQGRRESTSLSYSLTSTLQNSADSESIEHIRDAAPAVYYSQNRMVNGQDYNSFMLSDPSILKLKAVNRTFAGQPKHIEWNDASTKYQNVKIFGDDGRLFFDISSDAVSYKTTSRSLVDTVIEKILSEPGISNLISYSYTQQTYPLNSAYIRPRVQFIEDFSLGLQEKTIIQGALDRHWYGEPEKIVYLGPDLSETLPILTIHGVVNSDSDQRVYDPNLKLVTSLNGVYSLVSRPGYNSGFQNFVSKQKRFGIKFNPDRSFVSALVINPPTIENISDTLTSNDVTQNGIEDLYTIEIINNSGAFTVHSKLLGLQVNGQIGEIYTNGRLNFKIRFPSTTQSITVGDAFIIKLAKQDNILQPSIYKKNLSGFFSLIDESILTSAAESLDYNSNDEIASWIMIVERVDALDGSINSWRITKRNFKLTFESPTTKFYYNSDLYLVDPETKLRVYDTIKILKSNLNSEKTSSLGIDHKYLTVGSYLNVDGTLYDSALLVTPNSSNEGDLGSDGRSYLPFQFLDFIGSNDYVYFTKSTTSNKLIPAPTTVYLQSLTYVNNESGNIVRRRGRENLDFAWIHFADYENLIDPSPSNIIDSYVLTRGFYTRVVEYARGLSNETPIAPTPFELRTTYRTLLSNKMISDTVILHSAKIKYLFGNKANPELRAKLKIIKNSNSKLANDQIRLKVLTIINRYFDLENLDFGQSFYTTGLQAVIHKELPNDISSIVLVPEFPGNNFGDLMQINASQDEILISSFELSDILIIESLDKITMRQK